MKGDEKVESVFDACEVGNLDVLMVTETHLCGNVSYERKGRLFLNSGPAPGLSALKGVGFIVDKKSVVVNEYLFHGYSERVARLCIRDNKSSKNDINFVVAYAPTESSGDVLELDRFYCDLDHALKDCVSGKIIVGGDFNCRIGVDYEPLRHVVGKWCGLFTSDNGDRLIDFCHQNGLRVESTFFRHRLRQRTSWIHPATGRRELLDLLLARGVTFHDVRTYVNYDCGSDHDLVIGRFISELVHGSSGACKRRRVQERSEKRRYDMNALKERSIEYREQLKVRLQNAQGWLETEKAMQEALAAVASSTGKSSHDWFEAAKGAIAPLLKARAEARATMMRNFNEQTKSVYNSKRKAVSKAVKEAKDAFISEISSEIEECVCSGDTNRVKILSRQLVTLVREGSNGRLGREVRKINAKQLAEHFSTVFKKADNGQSMTFGNECAQETLVDLDDPPTAVEVEKAIGQLRAKRAPGGNGIPAEAFKLGGSELIAMLVRVYKDCWPTDPNSRASLFQNWREAEVFTLYKGKGCRNDPNNYRGIFLLDVAGKILAKVINNRLRPLVEKTLSESQFGFRPHRSTAQSIFLLKQMQQAARYKGENLVVAFVDLAKAFDSLPRQVIWDCLAQMGVPPRLLAVIRDFHEGARGKVETEVFGMERGVRQGCILGPVLFNVVYHYIVKKADIDTKVQFETEGKSVEALLFKSECDKRWSFGHAEYADDLYIQAHDSEKLSENLQRLSDACKPFGIEINAKKTKVMWLSRDQKSEGQILDIMLDGQSIDEVDQFCYLGHILTENGNMEKEVKHRIQSASGKLSTLKPVLASDRISTKSKIKMVKSVVLSTLLYASETWNTTAKDEEKLQAFLNTCKYRVAGRSRLDRLKIEELDRIVRIPHIRALLARRRLNFLASIFSSKSPQILRESLNFQIVSTNKKIGGRKVQEWGKRIKGDLEWYLSTHPGSKYTNTSDLLEGILDIGKLCTPEQRKAKLGELWNSNEKVENRPAPRLVQERVKVVLCEADNCFREFATRKEMLRHVRNDHVDRPCEDGQIKCEVAGCFKVFKTRGWLTRHMNMCHVAQVDESISQNISLVPASNVINNQLTDSIALSNSNPQNPDGDNALLVTGEGSLRCPQLPPWKCPFQGCQKVCGTQKGLLNHGTRDHNWSLTTGRPKQSRATKALIVSGRRQ
jgi:hypothetical protein